MSDTNLTTVSQPARNTVQLGGFAVWIAATALMMLHNGEATYARATSGGMLPFRAFIEAALTVLTIEVIGLYFLYAATKSEITPAQRRVAGWGVGMAVALGAFINLVGGVKDAETVLNISARVAQGVCLVLIARWHWVGHQGGSDLAETLAATQQELQQTQADLAQVAHQANVLVAANARLQTQQDAQPVAQPATTTTSRAVAIVAQPKSGGKINHARLLAQLEQGATATELAQLFGVSESAIRKQPEWKATASRRLAKAQVQ